MPIDHDPRQIEMFMDTEMAPDPVLWPLYARMLSMKQSEALGRTSKRRTITIADKPKLHKNILHHKL